MRTRDWAGTVLLACLIAAAALLRDHTLLLAVLGTVALVCLLVIVWDVSGERAVAKSRTSGSESEPSAAGIRAGHGIRAGGDLHADAEIEAGRSIDAGGNIRAGVASTPPKQGWVDPEELGNYLDRINRTMEEHGFGPNPNLPPRSTTEAGEPASTQVTETVTPESIERELNGFVRTAAEMILQGSVTQGQVSDWAGKAGITIRVRGPEGEEGLFLAAGRDLAPQEELEAKVARIQVHILPKVSAGDWDGRQ